MPKEPEPTEEELQEAMRRLGLPEADPPGSSFPEPPTDEEIEQRMADMRSKVETAGHPRMPAPPEFNFQRPKSFQKPSADAHGYKGLGIGMTAAYALVGMMALGFGLGWLFDHGPHSSNAGPAFGGLLGCIAGIAFVIWLINRPNQ